MKNQVRDGDDSAIALSCIKRN